MEMVEIKVGDDIYKVRKLSGYQVNKLLGGGGKDLADIQVDMILASVVEPKMKHEDVIALADEEDKYFALVTELERINAKRIRALGNYIRSSTPSQQKSETNSNCT